MSNMENKLIKSLGRALTGLALAVTVACSGALSGCMSKADWKTCIVLTFNEKWKTAEGGYPPIPLFFEGGTPIDIVPGFRGVDNVNIYSDIERDDNPQNLGIKTIKDSRGLRGYEYNGMQYSSKYSAIEAYENDRKKAE